MRAKFLLAWIVLGAFIVSPVGIVWAGGMGSAHWKKKAGGGSRAGVH